MTAIEFQYQLLGLHKSLSRFADNLTTNKYDSEDLVQDTFLKAILYQNKFTDDSNLKSWTFTIMKNTFINLYRKSITHRTNLEISDKQFLNSFISEAEGPESKYLCKEIHDKIDELKDEFRIPFEMHISGYKYREISDDLNLKIGTVKSRIFFCRKKLMKELSN